MIEPWGRAFAERTRGKQMGDECVVCGRHTSKQSRRVRVACSPVTAQFIPATLLDTPEGEKLEAGLYPVGSECAKLVRHEHPESFITEG